MDKTNTEIYKEKNNKKELIPKNILGKYHSIEWSKLSYNWILYMKEEINNDKVTKEKLKNPFYRLDFLKEYAFRYIYIKIIMDFYYILWSIFKNTKKSHG